MRTFATIGLLICSLSAHAEQKQTIGGYDVHYIVIPTMSLRPDIAAQYGIIRSSTQALVNISVVHPENGPVTGAVTGGYRNLLGQEFPLEFREVREQTAIYYLASFRYTDRDVLRFSFFVAPPEQEPERIDHQQQMFREES